MILKDLISGLDVIDAKGDLNIEIGSVAYDSRKVKPGSLFICIKGYKTNGHEYIPYALKNGAVALIVEEDTQIEEAVSTIKVKDSRLALAYIADKYFGHPSGKFTLIGVTGTKGKTTTTYMIKSILEESGQKVGLIGTIANSIGSEVLYTERTTPESYELQSLFADMAEKNVDTVVMEVSSHALELNRVSFSDYDIGIFTNLSRDHLDFHKNFENYLNAKVKLFKISKEGLVNIDNTYGEEVLKRAECKLTSYGIDKNADISAEDIINNPDSVEFKAVTPWGNEKVKVNIPGKFSVYNALAAIGACCLMKIPMDDIREGLKKVSVPGRAEIIDTGKNFTVMIDYAHSPDSLENILSTVKKYAPARVVCVFGCGGDRDRTKRPIMGEIAGRLADYTIVTSDNPRTEEPEGIISEIEEGIKGLRTEYTTIVDRREAIKHAIKYAEPNDIIVLAGKGHETYQTFKDKTIHFDEREVVREILNEGKN
ncbi:MAG TPA: UDP-N-acetylmuramoyl-L-alanyl-D-glutamate--2,6-diaminopimelate ligase [Clostridia bacterium]|nr:UDP-N-acetylmuramoyl-L-alanyl-D-glutamate--2,6-diaminopimelate ligase [Clostridia bacterium]